MFTAKALAALALGQLLIAVLVRYVYYLLLPKPIPGVPYNERAAKRILGDIPDMLMAKEQRKWMIDQPLYHGAPLAQIFRPLRSPLVIVSDYRTSCDIVMRRLGEFDRGPTHGEVVGFSAPTSHIVLSTTDPAFREHRELVKDVMTPTFLNKATAPLVYDNTATLIQLWMAKLDKAGGSPFDVMRDLLNFLLDATRSAAFGVDDDNRALLRDLQCVRSCNVEASPGNPGAPVKFPEADLGPEVGAIHDLGEIIVLGQASPLPWVSHALAMCTPRHLRAWFKRKSIIDTQTRESLKKLARHGESAKESALDQILWREMNIAKKLGRQPDFYASAIRDEMLGYLLGGYETTGTTIAWWIKYMILRQDVQARLRDDIRRAQASAIEEDRWPTVDEIGSAKTPYLDAVVEETLRIRGVVAVTARQATQDTQVLGYRIPKGTIIFLPSTGPGLTEPALASAKALRDNAGGVRLPDDWEEDGIGQYRPERWLKKDVSTGEEVFDARAGPTFAFSAGPRVCWGKRLAYVQLRIVVTLLMWNFEFLPVEGELASMEAKEEFTSKPRYMCVRLGKL